MKAIAEEGRPRQAVPRNLIELLMAREPSRAALTVKRGGRWEDMSWSAVLEEVKRISAGLVALDVRPGDRVAIFAATSLEWLLCDLAITAAGAITIPIYASNTPDECRYILNHSEAALLFVDHDEKDARQPGRLTRIRQRLAECPGLRRVVLFEGEAGGERESTLAELRRIGEQAHRAQPGAFEERVARIQRDDVANILYTSGTTGDPKGVLLTHGNWAYEGESLERIELLLPGDAVFLFLPCAHSFAQGVKAGWLTTGFRMIIAESMDTILANVAETRPTVLPSVPRVFEKVYNGVVASGLAAPGAKGRLFRWALRQFDEYVEARSRGREHFSLSFALARRLVFSKVAAAVREKLGGNLRLFVSGGAPLSPRIAYFFEMLGFIVLEGYGLTETAAGTSINRLGKVKIGTVGPALPGSEIRIAPDGEVLVRGPQVMKGYYRAPEATAEVLEPDGWFHSGDIGELDPEGYLRITDRKKDIIITAGGKNVAPQNIENLLKGHPIISQAVVHGDKRPYLTALICVSEEAARKLLADKGLSAGGYADLARHAEVERAVQAAIDQVNAELPPYASIKKLAILDHDLTQESGELTPTLKVKRKVCNQRYKAVLDGLYGGPAIG